MIKKSIILTSAMALTSVLFEGCGSTKHVVIEQPRTFVVYSPGENLTSLTKVHETEYVCDYPCGGDGGKNLFFVVRDNANYRNIYRKDTPTNMSMSQLTGGHSQNTTPCYCSAINSVAFSGRLNGSAASDIYVVNALQGGALTQVTNTPDYDESYPCFSRDGKYIVFEKKLRSASVKNTEIWIKNMKTNEITQLGLGCHPTFSPDGKKIAFVKYASGSYNKSLCLINIDGSNLTQLTDAGMGSVSRPTFSPNGRRIAFQCSRPNKPDADIYAIDVNGNNLTQLTVNESYDGEPCWTNDGNIYFTSDRGGKAEHYQIWKFRIESPTITTTKKKDNEVTDDEVIRDKFSNYHTVKTGETITDIARQYGVTVRDIVKWNQLTTMTISAGMRLKVSQ